jgi:PAS domain S-box-containing protein
MLSFLADGGGAGAAIRAHDWSSSALGDPGGWPVALKTLVGVMLGANQPMFVVWGTAQILLYNDAYAEILGGKHPAALGRSFLDVWSEIADDLRPIIARAYGGDPIQMDDITLVMERHGYPEEAHFAFSYTPIRGEGGSVDGFFCACVETTERIMAERSRRAAEAALRIERDRAQGVLDNMGDAFALLDRDFRIVDVNAEAMRLESRPREEIVGRTHWEAYPDADPALGDLYRHAMASRVPQSLEHRYVWPGGRETWLDMRAYPVSDGLAIFYRDITDRKRAEALLAESQARFRNMADNAPVMMWVTDPTGHCTHLNRRWYEFTGQAEGAGEGYGWIDAVHPDDRGIAEEAFVSANADRRDYRVEFRVRRADGVYRWTIDAAAARFGPDGEYLGYVGSVIDIDDRREQEAALQASTARAEAIAAEQAAILGQLAEGVIVTDRAGRITFVNDAAARIHGVARLDVEPDGYSDSYHLLTLNGHPYPPDELPLARAVRDGEVVHDERWRIRRPRGDEVLAIGGARPVLDGAGERIGAVLTLRDDTERSRAEAALRESEARYRTLFEAIEAGFCIVELRIDENDRAVDYRLIEVNPAFERQTGLRDAAGRWINEVAPGLEPHWFDLYREVIRTGEPARLENRAEPFGRWYDVHAFRIGDEAGRRVAILFNDITSRKEAERELRFLNDDLERRVAERTQERDRLWRNTQDLQVVLDGQGTFQAVSPAVTAILGWEPEELIGRTVFDFVLPDDLAPTGGALEHAKEASLPTFENRYRHKDGGHRWISWVASPQGDLIYASGRHVTAEKEREAELDQAREALRQAQKMEAVGQLTGGIAHDFNNMLAVVIGSLDLLGRRLGTEDDRARRYVDAATDGARRAALLTQRLLAFSRQQPLRPEPIDPGKLVTGMSDLIRGSIGSDIRFETVLAGGGWRAHADPNQLENVLLNLAVNARDAMPDGGRLTIETQNAHLDDRYAAAHPGVPPGQYVLIAVTDTGSGMPDHVIAKAFDPFYTTKSVGKGTGLGLSQVYGFVKQSGGHVKIYSEAGQGTTVKVYLPRLLGAERERAVELASPDLPLGERAEVVLVVEDEPAVRQFSTDALTELGYRVLVADGAAAALRLLDAHPEIALMFTDIVMPDVNGAKLADEARRRRPDLKVLFTTGYTRNAVVHNGVLDPGVELLGKPFTVEELAVKVRAMLDSPLSGRA